MINCQCCSIIVSASSSCIVDAPAHVLWDVITDFDALPQIIDTAKSVQIILPSPHFQDSVNNPVSNQGIRVQVGTQVIEDKEITKDGRTKVTTVRNIVTNVLENSERGQYSLSFNSYLQENDFPKANELVCFTSTFSINGTTSTDKTAGRCDTCEIIASYALGVGGFGSSRFLSCLHYCPCFCNLFMKQKMTHRLERQLQNEIQQYGTEAQSRHMKQQKNSAL